MTNDQLFILKPSFVHGQISIVYFKADEFLYASFLRSDRRISDSEKRIEHRANARRSVQFDAPFGQLNRKGSGMRSLFRAALDRLVGNKPGVATTARVASAGVRPARNVAFVLVRNADG